VREWSQDGAAERDACFNPLLKVLQQYLPITASNGSKNKVLIPGSGLGRLVFEVAKLGYETVGNEFSVYMLLFGFYMLNNTEGVNAAPISPYIDQWCHHRETADRAREILVPDVDVSKEGKSKSTRIA
jgi:carnosine N-methyltransferase